MVRRLIISDAESPSLGGQGAVALGVVLPAIVSDDGQSGPSFPHFHTRQADRDSTLEEFNQLAEFIPRSSPPGRPDLGALLRLVRCLHSAGLRLLVRAV